MAEDQASPSGWKAVLTAFGGIFALLFLKGAYDGWHSTRSDGALLKALLPHAYLVESRGELRIWIKCPGLVFRPVFEMSLTRDEFRPDPRFLKDDGVADSIQPIADDEVAQSLVLGGAGAKIYSDSLLVARSKAFAPYLNNLRGRAQGIFLVAAAAVSGYGLGRQLMSYAPPSCGSAKALSPLATPARRDELKMEIFEADQKAIEVYERAERNKEKFTLLVGPPPDCFTKTLPRSSVCDRAQWGDDLDPYSSELGALRAGTYSHAAFLALRERCRLIEQRSRREVCARF